MLTRSKFEKQMTRPRKRKVKSDYLAGLSGKERTARKAALLRLNKNTKGSGILPGDLNPARLTIYLPVVIRIPAYPMIQPGY